MELLSKVVLVTGILLFVYSLVKMLHYKSPITAAKDNNSPNSNLVKEESIEDYNGKAQSDHYGQYVALKSKSTPKGEAVGLNAEEAFFLVRNSKYLNK